MYMIAATYISQIVIIIITKARTIHGCGHALGLRLWCSRLILLRHTNTNLAQTYPENVPRGCGMFREIASNHSFIKYQAAAT